MGFLDKVLGRSPERLSLDGGVLTIRDRALAESLQRPAKPTLGDASPEPCPRCGQPLRELVLSTFGKVGASGRAGNDGLWLEVPVETDGWACVDCATLRFPRKMTAAELLPIEEAGVAHLRAKRLAEAERCFARLVWDWPGYSSGHLNYATALRERLRQQPPQDEAARGRLAARVREELERAVASQPSKLDPRSARLAAYAQLSLAEFCIEELSLEPAAHALEACLNLPHLEETQRARARTLGEYLEKVRESVARR
jgi:hypothetical protein